MIKVTGSPNAGSTNTPPDKIPLPEASKPKSTCPAPTISNSTVPSKNASRPASKVGSKAENAEPTPRPRIPTPMKRPVEPSADVVSTVGSTSNRSPKGPTAGFRPVPPVKEATLVSLLVKLNSAAEKSKPLRA